MYLRPIKNVDHAMHVAVVADAVHDGELISYEHGKPVKLSFYAQVLIKQVAYALFFDPEDGTYKAIQADPVTRGLRSVGYLREGDIRYFQEKQGVFLVIRQSQPSPIRPLDAA